VLTKSGVPPEAHGRLYWFQVSSIVRQHNDELMIKKKGMM